MQPTVSDVSQSILGPFGVMMGDINASRRDESIAVVDTQKEEHDGWCYTMICIPREVL